jgi:hypothetical protein
LEYSWGNARKCGKKWAKKWLEYGQNSGGNDVGKGWKMLD